MEDPRLNNIYSRYELSFLTDIAKEWGWEGKKKLMFIQRMLSSNNDLIHRELADVLDPVENSPRLGICAQSISEILSKRNNVYDRLEQLGLKERDLEPAQEFLRCEVFPEWVKPRLWGEIWKSAEPSDRIEIEVQSGGLLTAGSRLRPEDRLAIPEIPKIPLGANVEYHIPSAADRYSILLEKDGNGGIYCLAPSRGFPRFEIAEPIAREELLAVVSSQEPKLSWLESARLDLVELDAMDLQELMVWVQGNEDCLLLRREFEIVA